MSKFLSNIFLCYSKKKSKKSKPIYENTSSPIKNLNENLPNPDSSTKKKELLSLGSTVSTNKSANLSIMTNNPVLNPKIEDINEFYNTKANEYINYINSNEIKYKAERCCIEKILNLNIQYTHLLERSWGENYAEYLKNGKNGLKSIDNTNLLDLNENKEKLKARETYVLIDELFWKVIHKLYGGGPEIVLSIDKNSVIIKDFSGFKKENINNNNNKIKKIDEIIDENNTEYNENYKKNISKINYSHKNTNRPFNETKSIINNKPSNIITQKNNEEEIEKPIKKPLKLESLCVEPVGISNSSLFCFLNTGMQCLLSINDLSNYFKDQKYLDIDYKTKKNIKYSSLFSSLIKEMNKERPGSYIEANSFKKTFKKMFDPNEMHDCQEFIRFFISELQDELNVYTTKNNKSEFSNSKSAWEYYKKFHISIIDRLFTGQMESEIICKKCNFISRAFDPFLDLSLPINNCEDIYDCLNLLFQDEKIQGYQCERCKKTGIVQRSLKISFAPQILVLHLKRFKFFPNKMKINDIISYPINGLKMEKFCNIKEKTEYDLIAIVIHSGSENYGHYVAYGKRNNNWYFFDDERVRKISNNDLMNKEGYLLFYEKRQ